MNKVDCDVWLLTEVHVDLVLAGYALHTTADRMGATKYWSAILSRRPMEPVLDPHFATAMAVTGDGRFLSSVLPWRSCGDRWAGDGLAAKASIVLDAIGPAMHEDTVWGGDWNQSLHGPEFVGTTAGRAEVLDACARAGLVVPTALLASATQRQRSIDHIAVPARWELDEVRRIPATAGSRRLSDHDAYVVGAAAISAPVSSSP